ncbi:AraC family transcriptional regulator [Arthrobacter glacialis]|nr:AraC family transcriptional regulator [Arthrobacter glacialis]
MNTSDGVMPTARKSARALLGRDPVRELVPRDINVSARWHTHDFPSPLARWNSHPEFEIHLITKSHGNFIVGDHIGTFGPGHLAMVGADLPHDWISEPGDGAVIVERDVVFQFRRSWIDDCAAFLPELHELDALMARAMRGIEFSGRTALQGAQQLRSIGGSSGMSRLSNIFTLLQTLNDAPSEELRLLSNDWLPVPTDAHTATIVSDAISYVLDNLHTGVLMSEAASIAGMSSSAFSKYFKRASGHTFRDVVKQMRLTQACKMLQHSNTAVSTIASEVGYDNLSNFNRQFLSEYGCTPRQFRNRQGLPRSP